MSWKRDSPTLPVSSQALQTESYKNHAAVDFNA